MLPSLGNITLTHRATCGSHHIIITLISYNPSNTGDHAGRAKPNSRPATILEISEQLLATCE